MHSADFEALQLYQQQQKELMEKRMDGLTSAINEIKDTLEGMKQREEGSAKAPRGRLNVRPDNNNVKGHRTGLETTGPPSLNASKPQESDEPSMKDMMGVLSALARDVSELKGKRPSSPSPDGPDDAKIKQLLIILAEKQQAFRDAKEQDDKASLQTEIDALQSDLQFHEALEEKASAHYNLGVLLRNERQDLDGAIAAFRAAIAVDPG